MRTCRAPGCGVKAASRFSVYCSVHKARLRRHGAVDQRGIRKADLKPYLKLLRARIERNHQNPAWEHLEARWKTLAQHARSIVTSYERGSPGLRHERVAAQEVVRLANTTAVREVVETALAMFMMQELEPRRFDSDTSFRTQLVRRVRGLSEVNAGEFYDHSSGRTKRVYRELPPRATALMGLWLAETFGGAGLHLARLEQADLNKKNRERHELHKALSDLT